MNKTAIEQYHEILRRDFFAFVHRAFNELNPHTKLLPNWHLDVITATLEAVRQGKIRRLIINVPPRSLKSHCASIAFPAWLLGHNPAAQIITVSYAQDLAEKLARDCRALMSSSFYKAIFATRLSSQKQAVCEFETTQNGFRLSTSIGGVLTGRGADIIIIDDPLKPEDAVSETCRNGVNAWYDGTLYSRLNRKASGAIVIIMQRLHEDDLVGHVLKQEPWQVLSLPAIAEEAADFAVETPYGLRHYHRHVGEVLHPAHESAETLERIRQTIGSYNFAGQYQQAPAPLGGGIVKPEWFRIYESSQRPEKFDRIVQSWDTANTSNQLSDYTACTTWGQLDKHFYLLDVMRRRLIYPHLKRLVKELAAAFNADIILIEDKASGTALIQDLGADGMPITKYQSQLDKETRMHQQTAVIEAGYVHLPREAQWRADYLHELAVFPNGRFDDQVDATSQALDWMRQSGSPAGWLEYYRRQAERMTRTNLGPDGKPAPVSSIGMRAPQPHANFYVSGTNGRCGRYAADAQGLIAEVHRDDVERLIACGCTLV